MMNNVSIYLEQNISIHQNTVYSYVNTSFV